MKSFFQKIGAGFKFVFNKVFSNKIYVLLIVIGFLILVVSLILLLPNWILPLLTIATYILIVAIGILIHYLIKLGIKSKILEHVEGEEEADENKLFGNQDFAYKKYLRRKLKLTWILPLFIQRLFSRKSIYLCLGDTISLTDELVLQGWRALDNPANFPTTVCVYKKRIIINTQLPSEYLPYTLKLLSRYTFLQPISGVVFVTEANVLLEKNKIEDVFQQRNTLCAQLKKYRLIKHYGMTSMVVGFKNLTGAKEAYVVDGLVDKLNFQHSVSAALEDAEILALSEMQKGTDTLANAALQLFILSLKRIQKTVETSKNFVSDSTHFIGLKRTERLNLLQQTLQTIQQQTYSSYYRFWYRASKILIYAVTAIVFCGFIFSFVSNYSRVNSSQTKLQHYMTTNYRELGPSSLLSINDSLAPYQVFNVKKDNSLMHFGLYQGDTVQDIVYPVYQAELQHRFLPLLQQQLTSLLVDALYKQQNVRQALTAYLMLSQPEHYQAEQMIEFINNNAQQLDDKQLLTPNAKQILRAIQANGFAALAANKNLVNRAKRRLPSLASQLISELTAIANQGKQYNVLSLLTPEQRKQLSPQAPLKIAKLFTREGYKNNVANGAGDLVRAVVAQNWIYDQYYSQSQIKQQVLNAYIQAYIQAWETFTAQVQFTQNNDLLSAASSAERASKSNSAWRALLNIVLENTHLTGGWGGSNDKVATAISKHFMQWYYVIHGKNSKKTLKVITEAFKRMGTHLKALNAKDNLAETIFNEIKAAQKGSAGIKPFSMLNKPLLNVPIHLANWLRNIRKNMAEAMLITAKPYISGSWQQQVLPQVSDIMQQYPLNANSVDDVPQIKFSSAFSPSGVFASFLTSYITPFVDLINGQERTFYGAKMPFSKTNLQLFSKLNAIKNNFFNGKGKTLNLSFSLRPDYLSRSMAGASLNFLGKTLTYQHGPQNRINYNWPTKLVNIDSTLIWRWADGNMSVIKNDGVWSWLRLLQTAKIEPTTRQNNWEISFHHSGRKFDLNLQASAAMNLLLSGIFNQLTLPNTL